MLAALILASGLAAVSPSGGPAYIGGVAHGVARGMICQHPGGSGCISVKRSGVLLLHGAGIPPVGAAPGGCRPKAARAARAGHAPPHMQASSFQDSSDPDEFDYLGDATFSVMWDGHDAQVPGDRFALALVR